MSMPLLKIELKSNLQLLLLFIAVITLYGGMITAMYDPEIGAGMNEMAESMPELFAAFGMENPGTTLMDFLINYLYGFILIAIPLVYSILMSYKLMAKYIDRGSMAYLLSTGCSRGRIVMTQIFVLILGIAVLVAYATVLVLVCSHLMFEGELDVAALLRVNLGLLALHLFFGAFCFMFACLFNEIKYAVGLGAGLSLVFLLIQMLSGVSDDVDFLRYMTPMTLFAPEGLAAGSAEALGHMGILAAFAVLFLIIATVGFKKRDLPL